MKEFLILTLAVVVAGPVHAESLHWNSEAAKPAPPAAAEVVVASLIPNKFFYDLKTGRCVNPRGEEGLNKYSLAVVSELRDGECTDLHGVQLNGDDLSYPHLKGWNLRGADLRGARLSFAYLDDAHLRGAKMDGFIFGYAGITGLVDGFTSEPPCQAENNRVSCRR